MTAPEQTLRRWRHDMKNQLGIVLGFSDLLMQEVDSADTRRADLEEIHTAARRAMELLERIPASDEGSRGD